jgi:NADPH:quinone reductase-like Zn-dependent oxidoreductase
MKAIVYHNHRSPDPLRLEEIERPTPGNDEVLIKVRAASVNPIDYHLVRHPLMRRLMLAMSKSKINRPGRDVAGEVEAVGSKVTHFKPGDAVFGLCGGAFAEYACAAASALVIKPDNSSFEQAAAVPLAGLTALQALRDKAQVQPGQKILINGAAGGVGTFAVQIARSFGAEVTGVCSSRNVGMVRSLGADHVIDYTRKDFTKGGEHYDLIFDLVANHTFSACRNVLKPRGIYIGAGMVGLPVSMIGILTRLITERVASLLASQKSVSFMAKLSKDDLVILSQLMEAGKITPVIDRTYALSEVMDAIRYMEERHARGKVVIALHSSSSNFIVGEKRFF